MLKIKPLLLAFIDTVLLLAPVLICLLFLLAFDSRTIDGKQISWPTLSEWSFAATFLFVSLIRESVRESIRNKDREGHLMSSVLGSLAAISGAITGVLYAINAGLMPAPPQIAVLGVFQQMLFAGALLFHWVIRYRDIVATADT